MDFSTLLPSLVAAVAALITAFLGHTVGASALSADVRRLLNDLHAGHGLSNLQQDVADLQQTVADLKTVISAPKAPDAQ